MNFAKYKANRKATFDKLSQKFADQADGKGKFHDPDSDGYWQPSVDTTGNGYAEIRWLPANSDEDLPYVHIYSHGFKGEGGWYIEKCLTTIDKPDPAVEFSTKLWNTGNKAAQDRVSGTGPQNPGTKRKLNYHSNILVVKDPGNPEAEGKVFKFKYGPQIFEILNEAQNPKIPGEERIDPFDLFEGSTMRLVVTKVKGQRNYKSSRWAKPAPVYDDEEKIATLYNSIESLKSLLAPDKFKSYNTLKEKLIKVLGTEYDGAEHFTGEQANDTVESQVVDPDTIVDDSRPARKTRATKTKVAPVKEETVTENEGEDLEFFRSLRDQ